MVQRRASVVPPRTSLPCLRSLYQLGFRFEPALGWNRVRMPAVAAALAAGLLGGCLSDQETPQPANTAMSLPSDLAIAGADLLERNTTFARFSWRGSAPAGEESSGIATGAWPELSVPMPAGLPIAFLAGLRWNGGNSLEIETLNGQGSLCRPFSAARTWLTCAHAVRPLASNETWTVRVVPVQVAPPGQPFEVELRFRIDERILGLDSPDEPAPGCRPDRHPTTHGSEPGPATHWTVCWVHVGRETYEPTIGILSDGTVFAAPYSTPDIQNPAPPLSVARSLDAGQHWERITPGIGGIPVHRIEGDPYLYVDPVTDRVFFDELDLLHCGVISWSDDAGESWSHVAGGCAEADHQTIFAGPPRTSMMVGYPNVVYRCAINGGAASLGTMTTCSKSLDGGASWASTGAPAFPPTVSPDGDLPGGACMSAPGHGVVAADGRILLPQGLCGQPMLAMSHDEGLTWETVQVSDLGMPFGPANPLLVEQELFNHEANAGIDSSGTIYYGWIAADRLPYITWSDDAGATWVEPVMIGAPGLREASLGAMAVGGHGNLAFAYIGSTNSPGPPWDADYRGASWRAYLTVVTDASSEDRLTATAIMGEPFDPVERGECEPFRCGYIGDFIDVQIGPDGSPWAVYGDACDEGCALYDDAIDDYSTQLLVGRLVGTSLWDAADSNGPYRGDAPFTEN